MVDGSLYNEIITVYSFKLCSAVGCSISMHYASNCKHFFSIFRMLSSHFKTETFFSKCDSSSSPGVVGNAKYKNDQTCLKII